MEHRLLIAHLQIGEMSITICWDSFLNLDGKHFYLTWLSRNFPILAPDANEEFIKRCVRAYISQLV